MPDDGDLIPTPKLRDVARAAGVSQGTASNVFNHPDRVREEVRERVLAAARDLGYGGPSPHGRLLRAGKVNAIGVATVEPLAYFFEDPWARALLAALSRACDERGAGVALVSAQDRRRVAWNVQSALVDGFVLLCVEGGEELVELTRRRDLPFVAMSLNAQDRGVPSIAIDDRGGAALAARHLLGLGHRRFAILSFDVGPEGRGGRMSPAEIRQAPYANTRERVLGYLAALEEAGIAEGDVPIHVVPDSTEGPDEAMAAIFDAPEPPTAILAMSDLLALRASRWLRWRGLEVPGDVSITGFDGVPEAAMARPSLTTVAQPFERLARRAVAAILDDDVVVEGEEVMPVDLIVRESSGPPKVT
jgi:DNA-binding LacI/PurR family transcriptional regulator